MIKNLNKIILFLMFCLQTNFLIPMTFDPKTQLPLIKAEYKKWLAAGNRGSTSEFVCERLVGYSKANDKVKELEDKVEEQGSRLALLGKETQKEVPEKIKAEQIKFEEEIEKYKQELQSTKAKLEKMRKDFESMNALLAQQEKTFATKSDKFENLKVENERLKKEFEVQKVELAQAQVSIKEAAELRKDRADLQKELEGLENLKHQLKTLEMQNDQLKKQVSVQKLKEAPLIKQPSTFVTLARKEWGIKEAVVKTAFWSLINTQSKQVFLQHWDAIGANGSKLHKKKTQILVLYYQRDENDKTLLHYAVENVNNELINFYLNKAKELGLNIAEYVNIADKKGMAALDYILSVGSLKDTYQKLIEAK